MTTQWQQVPGSEKQHLKRVYYEGSDALVTGYCLCFNHDSGTASAADFDRASLVEKPAAANLKHFAGVVSSKSNGVTGPKIIEIVEPTGVFAEVYTEENCVIDTTVLTLKPASYAAGGLGEGPIIGRAAQTINRSSVNGTVLAQLVGLNRDQMIDGPLPSATINIPSYSIWDTCPWGTPYASCLFEDYNGRHGLGNAADGSAVMTGTSTTECPDWIQTEVTSGLTAKVEMAGGALRVSSEASVAANDGLCVMYRDTPWTPTAGKRIWFEARVRMVNVSTAGAEDQFFVGLANTMTAALSAGVVDDTVDKIGWFRHDGTTVLKMSFITAKTTVEEITADAATVADSTWINLGFVADLTTVSPYVNGVVGTAHATTTKLPTAATGLGICYAAVSEGTTIGLLDVDWIKIAQLR